LAGVSSACAPKVGKYNVCVHEFEAAALECLRCAGTSLVRTYENFSQVNSQTNLIVIDELGKMETYSNAFADAFEQLLDNQQSNDAGNTVLLVTMPMNATTQAPMMNTRIIRALVRANGGATTHTNVYEVTATNRNDLLNTICSRVESLLGLQNTM
jgi:nucleoside-triphosphatase THEP1